MKRDSKNYDVVILTHEPKDDLAFSLEMLLKQSSKPKRIILYNTDKKLFYKNIKQKSFIEKLLKNKTIKKIDIRLKDFDHGKARNDAMKYTTSEYVLYMTDDAVPCDENMAKAMLESFRDKNVAAVYARQIAKENAKLKEKYVREFNYPDYDIVKNKSTEEKYGIKNSFCSNSCCMYNKVIFKKLKGFTEDIVQNEDMLYAYKAIENGYKIVYKSKAKVYHSHDLSYIEQFKRNHDIGVFQRENSEIYDKYVSEKEGLKLIKEVAGKLLKGGHVIGACDFMIECAFRYLGYKSGKRVKEEE